VKSNPRPASLPSDHRNPGGASNTSSGGSRYTVYNPTLWTAVQNWVVGET